MTRKDYELIARLFWCTMPSKPDAGASDQVFFSQDARWSLWCTLVEDMADALANDNPRFNRETFLKACGLSS